MAKPLIIIATGNAHKAEEIQALLGSSWEFKTLKSYPDAPTPVEDAKTFEGNARIKADTIGQWILSNHPLAASHPAVYLLADDSGLEVDALDGRPGVRSARFAADDTGADGNSSDADNNAKLLRLLQPIQTDKKTARFRCALHLKALSVSDSNWPKELQAEGACEGRITTAPSGTEGFGYDPLFIPNGYDQSFAELGEATKNKLSHRAVAVLKLAEALTPYIKGL